MPFRMTDGELAPTDVTAQTHAITFLSGAVRAEPERVKQPLHGPRLEALTSLFVGRRGRARLKALPC